MGFLVASAPAAEKYDVLLKGGRIIDGTGAPWYAGDIGIRDGRIVRIGKLDGAEAERVIDAVGLIVCPGFVDMMGQTAEPFLDDPEAALNLLTQGVTTINAGEGHSPVPIDPERAASSRWRSLGEYFLLLEQGGMPINVAQSVGHTQIRWRVLGEVDRRPTPEELKEMQSHVRAAMEDGAIGLSTALIYPPATYGTTEEIAALASIVGEYGGRYYTHMRNEGDRLTEAIDEALEIGQTGNVPVHIFHLKSAGRQNWGKIDQAIARIKAARAEGRQVTADIYPYVNNGLGIEAFVHPRHFTEGHAAFLQKLDNAELRAQMRREMETEGGWENWYRHVGQDWNKVVLGTISAEAYREHAGQSLGEIARAAGKDPWDVFFEIVRHGAFAMPESMSEANKIKLMQQEFVSFCTDVGPAGGSSIASHPRAFGSFPRILSRYVRELGAVSLERAIAQGTAAAANAVMAYDRGRIAVGQAADIVVFDREQIADRATFAEPQTPSEGVRFVLVNGEVVLEDGKYTGAKPGRVLRGPGYRQDREPCHVATGETHPKLERLDRLMEEFVREHGVPGAALAVTDRGRLVYARGFGYADFVERRPATPHSRFRIASVSKPITAVAILQLVEQGRVGLDDKVFELLTGYEPHLDDGAKLDERQKQITIRQLLQHTGGWDRDESFDAMFESVRFAKSLGVDPPAGPDHVIRCMLGVPLDFDPGERYAYSNYGYCLLGRVIEKLTGLTYEGYVRQHVLAPLGITGMRIGKTHPDYAADPDEVHYYECEQGDSVFAANLGKPVPWPYGGWYLEAMDAHGAWVASAVDLARLVVAFDDPDHCPLLKPETFTQIFERPAGKVSLDDEGHPKPNYYGLGFSLLELDGPQKINFWHTGSLAGTATLMVHRHDDRNFVVLFNARKSRRASHLGRAIDSDLQAAIDGIAEWPEHDLFQITTTVRN